MGGASYLRGWRGRRTVNGSCRISFLGQLKQSACREARPEELHDIMTQQDSGQAQQSKGSTVRTAKPAAMHDVHSDHDNLPFGGSITRVMCKWHDEVLDTPAASLWQRASLEVSVRMVRRMSRPLRSTKTVFRTASLARRASAVAVRCCMTGSEQFMEYRIWFSTLPTIFSSRRFRVFCTQSLDGCKQHYRHFSAS